MTPAHEGELLDALKDAVQVARNYYMLFHDETWQARFTKWESAIAHAEASGEAVRTAPQETLRRDVASMLDNLYGLHARPGHVQAVLDVFQLHAPVKVPVGEAVRTAPPPALDRLQQKLFWIYSQARAPLPWTLERERQLEDYFDDVKAALEAAARPALPTGAVDG